MPVSFTIVDITLLVPLAVLITYYDVRYRRIPNAFVLATLVCGLLINGILNGLGGLGSSVGGCLVAFGMMFALHLFGAMGAGDVKLFAAIGSVIGLGMVVPTFVVVVLTGGVLAVISTVRARAVVETAQRVLQILLGFLPGWQVPRFAVPADRRLTIPYGVAICFGSLISLFLFRA
jgi:prepilin peptidase CpaA